MKVEIIPAFVWAFLIALPAGAADDFDLPDPLKANDGAVVKTADDWTLGAEQLRTLNRLAEDVDPLKEFLGDDYARLESYVTGLRKGASRGPTVGSRSAAKPDIAPRPHSAATAAAGRIPLRTSRWLM